MNKQDIDFLNENVCLFNILQVNYFNYVMSKQHNLTEEIGSFIIFQLFIIKQF